MSRHAMFVKLTRHTGEGSRFVVGPAYSGETMAVLIHGLHQSVSES